MRERRLDHLFYIFPVVMKVQRGAVVDEVERLVPNKAVGVARGAIDIGHKRIEPHGRGGEARFGAGTHRGSNVLEPGQIVEGQVRPTLALSSLADFVVGLVRRERRRLRQRRSQGLSDRARRRFRRRSIRHQSERPLPAREIEDTTNQGVGPDYGGSDRLPSGLRTGGREWSGALPPNYGSMATTARRFGFLATRQVT